MSAFRNLEDTAHKQMAVRKLKEAQQLGNTNPERVAELLSQAKYCLPYAQAMSRKDAVKKSSYGAKISSGPQDGHHKGFLIKANFTGTEYYIMKDGHNIGTAKSIEAAKKTINEHLT
jgi:hypothetical protein